jgi:hypothetical protein
LGITYAKTRYEGTAQELNVLLLGDIHWGAAHVDTKLMDKLFDYLNEYRSITRIVLMGDEIENANRHSIGAGVYEQDKPPQDQLDEFVSMMEPYSDITDGIITSNHVERTYKETGINVTKIMADRLRIPYLGDRAVINMTWGKRAYPFYVRHGSGGGGSIAAIERHLHKMVGQVPDAMIYAIAHFHRCYNFQDKCNRLDLYNHKLRYDPRTYICTGTALQTGGYADTAGLDLVQTGFPIVKLNGKNNGDKAIKVDWLMG